VQRTQLRPGTKVADAGDDTGDEYTGPVDPKLMSLGNWSFYQRANLGAKASTIFNGPFVIGDPARPGHLLHAGRPDHCPAGGRNCWHAAHAGQVGLAAGLPGCNRLCRWV
jgi:hypothetical protein